MIRGKKEKWTEKNWKARWMQMNSTSAAHRWPRPFFNSFWGVAWLEESSSRRIEAITNSNCGCTTDGRANPGEKVEGVSSCRAAAAPAEAQIRQGRRKKGALVSCL